LLSSVLKLEMILLKLSFCKNKLLLPQHQVSFHTRKRVRYLQEKSEQSVFEKIPINENTYVLGMDSNKPSGCVAGGLSSKRGVKLSINFNLLRNKYFDKAGVSDAHRR